MRKPIFRDDVQSQRIGNEAPDDAESHASYKKRHGIGHDLLIDAGRSDVLPGKRRKAGAVAMISAPVHKVAPRIGTSVQGLLRKAPAKSAMKFRPKAQVQKTTMTV